MKKIVSFVALLLCLSIFCGLFAGCNAVSENSDYITKGEFFAMFIEAHQLYSDVYSDEDMENSTSYDMEAATMLEWELIDKDQTGDLAQATAKDLLAQCCVRYMSFRQEGTTPIKDIEKCHDQQAVKDAVGMGIFELDNGYFDAMEPMTYDDCRAAIEKTNEVEKNTDFSSQQSESDKDKVATFSGKEILDVKYYGEEGAPAASTTALASASTPAATDLLFETENGLKLTHTASNAGGFVDIKIPQYEYESNKDRYKVGGFCCLDWADPAIRSRLRDPQLTSVSGKITNVVCESGIATITVQRYTLEAMVEEAGETIDRPTTSKVEEVSKDQIDDSSSDVKEGLTFDTTKTGIIATFKHTFSMTDPIYTNQTWRNPSASPSITVTAKLDNFAVTTENLGKMILGKGKGSIQLTYDTELKVIAEAGGLRYSPANNGNGKAKSNFKNSRFTGASAGGSKDIKLFDFNLPTGYGFFLSGGIYLHVEMDGSINVTVKQEHCYQLSCKSGGKPKYDNLTKKPSCNLNVNANISVGLRCTPNVKYLSFGLVGLDMQFGGRLDAKADIYNLEDEPQQEGVYATQTELDEQSSQWHYCIDTTFSLYLSGDIVLGAGLKSMKDAKTRIKLREFSWELGNSHFEDGKYMSSCSRGKNGEGAVEVNSDGEILLDSYKAVLDPDQSTKIKITSVPINDKKIQKKDGIKIKSKNPTVATATIDKDTKTILIYAKGSGSTELVVQIQKNKSKKTYYTQEISVTVNGDTAAVTKTSAGNGDDYVIVPLLETDVRPGDLRAA